MINGMNDALPLVSQEVRADLRRVAFALQDTELFPWLLREGETLSLSCYYRFGFRIEAGLNKPMTDSLKRKKIDLGHCAGHYICITKAALCYLLDHSATIDVLKRSGCLDPPGKSDEDTDDERSLVRALAVGGDDTSPREGIVMSMINGEAFVALLDRLGIRAERCDKLRPALIHKEEEDEDGEEDFVKDESKH